MSLSKQFLSFTFNQLSQDSGSKHILPGGLVNASNCLRGQTTVSKKGPLTKRKGFSRTSPSFSGASWTDATATSGGVLPGDGSNLLGVDGSDRKWTYDSDAATWRSAGLVVPVFPRTTYAIPLNLRTTCMVEAGNNLWFFAHEYSTSANDKGWYTVIDTTSGVVIQAPTRWTLSAALPITLNEAPMLCAAYDNSSAVWVFDGASAYKFVVATPSVAPTTTAFAICTVTGAANDFTGGPHCRWLSGISKIAVVGFGRSIAPAAGAFIQVAYLNTATGLKATDVPNVSAALGADQFFNGRILVSDGSNGSWYVAMRNAAAGIGTAVTTKLFTITASTLAIAQVSITAFTMVSAAVATNPGGYGGVCGYLAANGDRVVYSTDTQLTASNVTHAGKIHRTVYTGAATSTTFFGGFITSDPVLYGGNWYLMTGLHEILANASYIGLQRSLFLRNATGEIVCQIMPGQGPSYGNTLQSAVPSASSSTAGDGQTGLKYCHVTDLIAVGSKLINGAAINELSRGLVAAKVTIDMAPVWSKPAMLSASSAVSGGGVLQTWGKADAIREDAAVVALDFPNGRFHAILLEFKQCFPDFFICNRGFI